jgi:hypothetical protein
VVIESTECIISEPRSGGNVCPELHVAFAQLSPMGSGNRRPMWTKAAKALGRGARARLSHRRREERLELWARQKANAPYLRVSLARIGCQSVPAFGKAVQLHQNISALFRSYREERGSTRPLEGSMVVARFALLALAELIRDAIPYGPRPFQRMKGRVG